MTKLQELIRLSEQLPATQYVKFKRIYDSQTKDRDITIKEIKNLTTLVKRTLDANEKNAELIGTINPNILQRSYNED